MKYTKFFALFFVSIFLLTTLIPCTIAQSENDKVIDTFFEIFFRRTFRGRILGRVFTPFMTPWKPVRFSEPDQFEAEPKSINVKYLDKTEITIGAINTTTGNYLPLNYERDSLVNEYFPAEDFEFSLEIPDYIPEGVFITWFDPPMLIWGQEGEMKTKLIIQSNIPENLDLPKEITFRVNITKYLTAGNLYVGGGIMWFLYATGIIGPHPFGKLYSGKRLPEPSIYIDIIVHLDRFHLAEIIPPITTEIKPDSLVSIPIQIENQGSHEDTFNFRVSTDNDCELLVAAPSSIVLEPGEIGFTTIGVASPRILNDPGTSHSIKIEAYSIYEPDKIFDNTAVIITRGIYVSELNIIFFTIITLLILFGISIIFYKRRKTLEKIYKKPEKPWTIPIEKRHLEELKQKDKKSYEKERLMMEDEYKSAMLWYTDHLNEIKKERKLKLAEEKEKPVKKQKEKSESKLSSLFKKSEKKEKPSKKEKKPEEKVEKPVEIEEKSKETPEIIKDQYTEIKKRSAESERKKQIALEKIKRAQEKQIKKMK